MFSQFNSRISSFNRARNMLDVNLGSIAALPIPSINERGEFSVADLLSAEPTPSPTRDVDTFDVPSEFPKLYLPSDGAAAAEPQGTLNTFDVGTLPEIGGLPFVAENFNFPAYPTDLESTAFPSGFSVDEGSLFRETVPTQSGGLDVGPQISSENDFILQSQLGIHLGDLANSPELLMLMSMPELSPDYIESYASSVFTTPGPATPISSTSPPALSTTEEQSPPPTLWEPQPCLAVPTFSDVATTVQELTLKEEDSSSVLPVPEPIQGVSASSTSDPGSCSRPTTLPDDFFYLKRSSAGAERSSRKKARVIARRKTKARRSSAANDKNKYVPCTYEGCTATFYDSRVLKRHLENIHLNRFRWYCPGACEKSYTREDALNRHLKSTGENSSCQTAAKALGWDPLEKCSVQKLRTVSPSA